MTIDAAAKDARTPRIGVSFVALAALLFVAGAARAEEKAAGAVDAAGLWKKNCAACHGEDGKGKTKAGEKLKVRDMTDATVKATMTKAKAVESIKNGAKAEGSDKLAMKGFGDKLSAAEIEALADHSLAFK